MSKKMGLPFDYQKLPEYFDAWNINESTEKNNALIEKLLRKHKVKTVLDMTCGTGSQVFYLAERGYQCVGSDFSPGLLKIARKKAKNKPIEFIDGDMRTLKVGEFDAVITIFNAIGHLSKSDFAKALCNIHHNLKPGGIYIFDIFNLDAMTDKVVAKLACDSHKKVGNTQILSGQCSTLNKTSGILTSYDNVMIQKCAAKPKSFSAKFSLQIYTAAQLKGMLNKSGFSVIDQFDICGNNFVRNKSLNVITIAKKF